MDNEECKKLLKNFLDDEGKLKQWPTKRKLQVVGLCYCANLFDEKVKYTEKEVNEIICSVHTFGDHCMLRRDLVDFKFLARTPDNRTYWKLPQPYISAYGL